MMGESIRQIWVKHHSQKFFSYVGKSHHFSVLSITLSTVADSERVFGVGWDGGSEILEIQSEILDLHLE